MSEAAESQTLPARRRRLALWLSVPILLVSACLLVAPSLLRAWLEHRLRTASGLEVEIAGVEPTWHPLGVALVGVELRAPASPVPLLQVSRLEIPWRAAPPRAIGALLRPGLGDRVPGAGGATTTTSRAAVVSEIELIAPVIEAQGDEVLLPDARLLRLVIDFEPQGGLRLSAGVALAGGELAGWVRRAPDGARASVTASLRAVGLDLAQIPALGRFGVSAGELSGRLRLRGREGAAGRLRGRIAAQGFRGRGPGSAQVELARLEARGLGIDLASRRATARYLGARDGEIRLRGAATSGEDPPAAPWSFLAQALELRDLRIGSVDALPSLHVEALDARRLGGPEGSFSLTAAPTSGGRIRARGELDTRLPKFRADVDLHELTLGPWIEAFEPRVHLTSGRFDGRFEIQGPPGVQGRGTLSVEDVRVLSARPGGRPAGAPAPGAATEGEILRLERLHADLRGFTLAPLRLWLTSAEIEAPALRLTRTAAGLEPLDLLGVEGAGGAAEAPDAAANAGEVRAALQPLVALLGDAPPLSLPSVEVQASVRGGTIHFRDEQVSPPFSLVADQVAGGLSAWDGPPWGIVRAEIEARVDQASRLALRGEIGGPRLEVAGEVSKLRLEPWRSYLTTALGYAPVSGTMDASVDLTWERQVSAPTRLVLEGVALERATGEADRLEGVLGMPLDRALDLMRDGSGRTELLLRLEGDAKQPALGLVAALPAALREALPEAVTVPLFEGSDLVGRAGAEHVRLAPLRFDPGESALATEASRALERLAVVLRWDADLVATIAGAADQAELGDAARRAGKGTPAGGPPGDARGLLATRRAEAVRERLVAGFGIAPERVRLAPSTAGEAAVRIELRPAEGAP